MGIIIKQSIKGAIYSYVGVLLGFVTTGLLYPLLFSTQEVGLLRILVSYSLLFAQFSGLGINTITVKFFPHFRNFDKKHHGYLGFTLLVSLVGLILSIIAYLLFKPVILNSDKAGTDLFVEYFYFVIPLIISTLLFNVFDTYYRVLYNAVKGIVYKEVVQRLLILSVIILYYFNIIDFHYTVILYVIALITPTFLLFLSLIYNKQLFIVPRFNSIYHKFAIEMIKVGVFGMLVSFSGVLSLTIDSIMVERMINLSSLGVYTIAFFFGTLVIIPLRTMVRISTVVISDAWKANDLETINTIYKKSSINLSIVGLLLLIGIWGNINNVFEIIPSTYESGRYVILIIGISNLVDIALSVSPQIIVNSKHYKYLSYFLFVFAVILVVSNYILIPMYGIVGAAFATLISKIIYNFIKYVFLYRTYKLQPFTFKILLLYMIGGFAYAVSLLLPQQSNYIIDILLRSIIISSAFFIPVYIFKISDDINEKVNSVLTTIFK